ncbi:tetratricopeptide repeat protein [Hufsiella ginkgonis]|uniref:Tetratricopeptide repeat protein n=1 Tax=Hufsiella ginkgonis TaxID=2695274 RepID=A0A7K1XY21_9SPHI|nr:tetratricopeptide repeat protein [Hufsiella ginkgonis]MXV15728.1 tetratricopeptide repeat protein [Hufsiella ginkgonis]
MKRLALFLLLVLPFCAFAEDPSLFGRANAQYAKSQYKEAAATYRRLISEGFQSAPLYYNMANACYKTGDIPSAILYYEKAARLSPGDEDIRFNLLLANSKITDKIEAVPEFFLAKWWRSAILAFPADALAACAVVFILLGSAAVIAYFFAGSVALKKGAFFVSLILVLLGLAAILMAGLQERYFRDHHQSVVFEGSVTVKSGPSVQSKSLFVVHSGTKVDVLETNGGWIRISLASGNEGWMPVAATREI